MQLTRVWSQMSASKQPNQSVLFLQSFLTFPALEEKKLLFILIYSVFLWVKGTGRVIGTLAGFNLLGGLSNGEVFPNEQINTYLQAFPT